MSRLPVIDRHLALRFSVTAKPKNFGKRSQSEGWRWRGCRLWMPNRSGGTLSADLDNSSVRVPSHQEFLKVDQTELDCLRHSMRSIAGSKFVNGAGDIDIYRFGRET